MSWVSIELFILFGKFSRNTGLGLSKDIINVNEKTFDCRLKFKIGDDLYVTQKKYLEKARFCPKHTFPGSAGPRQGPKRAKHPNTKGRIDPI